MSRVSLCSNFLVMSWSWAWVPLTAIPGFPKSLAISFRSYGHIYKAREKKQNTPLSSKNQGGWTNHSANEWKQNAGTLIFGGNLMPNWKWYVLWDKTKTPHKYSKDYGICLAGGCNPDPKYQGESIMSLKPVPRLSIFDLGQVSTKPHKQFDSGKSEIWRWIGEHKKHQSAPQKIGTYNINLPVPFLFVWGPIFFSKALVSWMGDVDLEIAPPPIHPLVVGPFPHELHGYWVKLWRAAGVVPIQSCGKNERSFMQ